MSVLSHRPLLRVKMLIHFCRPILRQSDFLVCVCGNGISLVHVVGAVCGALQRGRVPEAAGAVLSGMCLHVY